MIRLTISSGAFAAGLLIAAASVGGLCRIRETPMIQHFTEGEPRRVPLGCVMPFPMHRPLNRICERCYATLKTWHSIAIGVCASCRHDDEGHAA